MKPLHFLTIALTLSTFATAQEKLGPGAVLAEVAIKDGKALHNAKATRIDGDAITFTHSKGIARVPVEKLDPALAARFGLTPETVAKARALAAKKAASAAHLAEKRRAAKAWRDATETLTVTIDQVLDDGILVSEVMVNAAKGADYFLEGSHFIGMDARNFNVYDGMRTTIKAVGLAETYSFTTVLGASRTVKAWQYVPE